LDLLFDSCSQFWLKGDSVTITRVGTNEKYSDGWNGIFGGKASKKVSKESPAATEKAVKTNTTKSVGPATKKPAEVKKTATKAAAPKAASPKPAKKEVAAKSIPAKTVAKAAPMKTAVKKAAKKK